MSGSSFTSNSADIFGGGLDNFGTATVSDSSFTGNSAGADGGGLSNFGTATVSGSSFTSNSADLRRRPRQRAWRDGDGERQLLHQQLRLHRRRRPRQRFGTATVSGSSFTSNSAGSDGGGLANFGTATVSGSSFTSNSAGVDGGGINEFRDADAELVTPSPATSQTMFPR